MTNGKPTISQIVEACKNGHGVQYEIVTYRGVDILMLKRNVENAIKISAEFTHSPDILKLAGEMGITQRRFR